MAPCACMLYEQLPDEWKEWLDLTPLERFRRSEEIFAQYLAMGGSLDPDPDPTSPFYAAEDWQPGGGFWRPDKRTDIPLLANWADLKN